MHKYFAITLFLLTSPACVLAQQNVSIGYFNEWPLPVHSGRQTNMVAEALQAQVSWQDFNSATDMSSALENGTIHIAMSQGIVPVLIAANQGKDVSIVDIAVSYSGSENCVVRSRLNISADNAAALEELKVALPIGTTVHFSLLKQMQHLGVDSTKLTLIDLSPARAAAAFANAEVDMACGWGDPLEQMKKRGNVLLDGAELVEIGIFAFDTIAVQSFYGKSNTDILVNTLNIIDKYNFSYSDDPTPMIDGIASTVGIPQDATRDIMDSFTFLPIDQKLNETWLGGGVQAYIKSLADFFVEQGTMPTALESYDDLIDVTYLEAVLAVQLAETTNDASLLPPQQ